jgi:hypothetical protein
MDPATAAGLALAVIGLVPLCATGFQLIENSVNASKDAAKAFDSITFQSGVRSYSISYDVCLVRLT